MSEVERITLKKSRDEIEDEVDYEEYDDDNNNELSKKVRVEEEDNIQDEDIEDNEDIIIEAIIDREATTPWPENLDILIANDARFGWPKELLDIPVVDHGWFRPGNVELLDLLLDKDMKCVIEIGSWYVTPSM
jgi:hypothetical protein